MIQPDLIGKEAIFELKSRTYPLVQNGMRKRPRSDFEWWPLDVDQIKNYEGHSQNSELTLYWLLLLGQSKNAPTEMRSVSERSILYRDIYVLPWDAHHLVDPAPSGKKHLGLSRIKSNYAFSSKDIPKGSLHVEGSIESRLRDIF
ncbi:hypothetical protein HOD05_00205 [Candidatus Woesearchaeota archaeon]|jgi:hypothetical protein|nr:hypothetical protein [Candidatus Woesearchaeota archaeon]MBT4150832.1 hypothetical protein [Candidatus Woesearchaeota archaeon]MBT4246937.1 hypothetical protein [Candidatus Woesearchaeota archaeon]MBT4433622.1 hypothetical protein [Candidatus Woesearchaeota archaeon]